MSKIEKLKLLLQTTGMALPIGVRDETFLVDEENEMICNTEAANPEELELIVAAVNAVPQLLQATALVVRARELVSEAINVHIYDEDNGETPDPDCQYQGFLNEADTLLDKLNREIEK